MNIKYVLFFIALLLSGCVSALDDASRAGSQYVDDLMRFTSRNSDDIVKYTVPVIDDAVRQLRYWNNTGEMIISNNNLSTQQYRFTQILKSETSLSDGETLVYLNSLCSIYDHFLYFVEYPTMTDTERQIRNVAISNNIEIFSIADFAYSVYSYSSNLISESEDPYQEAKLYFEALCLIPQ